MRTQARESRRASSRRWLAFDRLEARHLLATLAPAVIDRPVVDVTDLEQMLVEQINVSRADPGATAARLQINLNDGLTGTQQVTADAKAPLAIRAALGGAAGSHSLDMLARDYFSHTSPDGSSTPATRATAAGYLSPVGENIAVRSLLASQSHELLALHDQLFLSPSHRANLLRPDYSDVGVGVRQGEFLYSNGGVYESLMATELFGIGPTTAITGVVFSDNATDNGRYDAAEGIVGAVVEATATDGTIYRTRTGNSGGYTIDVPVGTYTVRVSGSSVASPMVRSLVQITGRNVKVDFDTSTSSPGLVGGLPVEARSLDASGDGAVTPRDALLVLNYLIDERSDYDASLDTTQDGVIAPLDVLFVVNYLNSSAEGEGEEEELLPRSLGDRAEGELGATDLVLTEAVAAEGTATTHSPEPCVVIDKLPAMVGRGRQRANLSLPMRGARIFATETSIERVDAWFATF